LTEDSLKPADVWTCGMFALEAKICLPLVHDRKKEGSEGVASSRFLL
jgi:hypothetical protein